MLFSGDMESAVIQTQLSNVTQFVAIVYYIMCMGILTST